MHGSNLTDGDLAALRCIFELGATDVAADAAVIARQLHGAVDAVAHSVERLRARGLVQAHHTRLTMAGLVVAVALPPSSTLRVPRAA